MLKKSPQRFKIWGLFQGGFRGDSMAFWKTYFMDFLQSVGAENVYECTHIN